MERTTGWIPRCLVVPGLEPWTLKHASLSANAMAGSIVVGIMVIGIQLFMVIYGFSVLLETPPSKRQGRLPYMFISLTLFALPTIAALVLFHRYFNIWRDMNGPLDYFPRRKTQGVWATYLNNALYCVTILLGDGLLLFRCYIIWADRLWVLVLPALLFISSVVLSTIFVVLEITASTHRPYYFTLWTAFVSCSVSLVVLITALICGRLLHARWRIAKALGVPFSDPRARGNGNLTSASAILIESALPLALFGLIEAIQTSFTGGKTRAVYADTLFNALYTSFAMIIFRVTTGRSWASHAGLQESLTPSKLNIGPILVTEDANLNFMQPRASGAGPREALPLRSVHGRGNCSDLESLCEIESHGFLEVEGEPPAPMAKDSTVDFKENSLEATVVQGSAEKMDSSSENLRMTV